MADKKADLAGPGIGDYLELEKVLPTDYSSLLSPKRRRGALAVTHADASAAQGASRRSERDGMAESAEEDVRKEEYSRAELSRLAGVTLSEGEGESPLAKS